MWCTHIHEHSEPVVNCFQDVSWQRRQFLQDTVGDLKQKEGIKSENKKGEKEHKVELKTFGKP